MPCQGPSPTIMLVDGFLPADIGHGRSLTIENLIDRVFCEILRDSLSLMHI